VDDIVRMGDDYDTSKCINQRLTAELVTKFVVSTTQFINRFAAVCDRKLGETHRKLQRLEVQIVLLEKKLDSADAEAPPPPAMEQAKPEPVKQIGGGPPGVASPKGIAPPPGVMSRKGPPPPPGIAAKSGPPPPPGLAGRKQPPPPPGVHSGPPLPPGALVLGGPKGPAPPPPPGVGMAPPPGAPPIGFIPPPPPPRPIGGGMTVRTDPRLAGYFKMLDVGIPISAIKAKMQKDGIPDPNVLDTPDAPSPLAGKPMPKSGYDSE
jgi:WASH complex subunit CCDC53